MEGLFDSHTHLPLPAFAKDRQAALDRAREAGVAEMVVVGIDGNGSREATALAARQEGVYAAVGFHPHEAKVVDGEALRLLRELAAAPGVVALGEVGLDFYRNLSPHEAQARAFREQLALAAELGLPVIIHSREAAAETYAILQDWLAEGPRPEGPVGVLHCFSGDLAAAQRYVEMGFMISVAGNVTYPNAARLLQSYMFSAEGQQINVDIGGLRSVHPQVKEKPGRRPFAEIKKMKDDPVAVEKQSDEIKAHYTRIFKV